MNKRIKRRSFQPAFAEITLPASKSISNRLLIMQYLSGNRIMVENLSMAEDTLLMQRLLQETGRHVTVGNAQDCCTLNCNNAGTVFRFLTALLAIEPGSWILTGSDRMKKRPVSALCDALIHLGASIEYCEEEGFPPIKIQGRRLNGGKVQIDASRSSQYVSALLMIAPLLPGGLRITLKNNTASKPYIDMTLALMKNAGINAKSDGRQIKVEQGEYGQSSFVVEPDWSSASYWYEIAALMPEAAIMLHGLSLRSLQGDALLPDIFSLLGVGSYETGEGILLKKIPESLSFATVQSKISFDLSQNPDLAPALAATCTGLNVEATLTGLGNLIIKESNRLLALQSELSKINPLVRIISQNGLFTGRQRFIQEYEPVFFSTYADHRMAMALAPLAACCKHVIVENPEVVAKSYPGYWDDLRCFFDLDPV